MRKMIYMKCGHTDMRMGIDGLAGTIIEQLELDPFDHESIYIFCGRRKDRFKILYWEKSGFTLLYKRIERGRIKWVNKDEKYIVLTEQQYKWLMEGLSIYQRSAIQEVENVNII